MGMNRIERLLAEILVATFTTATVVVCFRYLDIPSGHPAGDLLAVGIPVAIAGTALLIGPLCQLWRERGRHYVWAHREPHGALMGARVAGIAFGAWVGAVLQASVT
ncbi:hypothetical protein WJ542_30425 [Paraburkholderia sp. B3]|uniref:hypothetical protein n=1 Tax=Paraburkholderia sp. B3 TaxID=3134791 RepID=UPI003982429C